MHHTPSSLTPHLPGNATYSGAFAAIMANVVLITYIIVAVREEDDTKGPTGKIESKKVQ